MRNDLKTMLANQAAAMTPEQVTIKHIQDSLKWIREYLTQKGIPHGRTIYLGLGSVTDMTAIDKKNSAANIPPEQLNKIHDRCTAKVKHLRNGGDVYDFRLTVPFTSSRGSKTVVTDEQAAQILWDFHKENVLKQQLQYSSENSNEAILLSALLAVYPELTN